MRTYPKHKGSGVPWLGDIPEGWELCRAKYLFALENRPVEQGAGVVTCFRDGMVTLRSNRRTAGFTESLKETGYQGVKKGDLVIHQMDAFAGAVGVSDSDGKSTPVYSVCTPKRPLSPFFIAYQIREMARSNYIVSLSRGIRQRSSDFRFPVFANCVLALPSLVEQRSITNYLDKKSAEIDELVSRRQQMIEKLRELKKSIIAQAVTKGIRPNRPLKDSGVPWLGEVPSDWELVFLRSLFAERKSKNVGMLENNLLSLSYGKIVRRPISKVTGLTPQNYEGYNIVQKNDIVLRLTDLQNDQKSLRSGLVRERGIVTSAYLSLRPKGKRNSAFYQYQLYVFDTSKSIYSMGNGVRQTFGYKELSKLQMAVPAADEQQEIVDYLDKQSAGIDEMIARHTGIIEKLKELKVSLIANVVTGKVDVREQPNN